MIANTAGHSGPDDELRQLADGLVCGTLSAEQRDRLALLIADNEDARAFCAAYANLHAMLRWRFRPLPPEDLGGTHEEPSIDRPTFAGQPVVAPIRYSVSSVQSFLGEALFSYLAAAMILGVGLLIAWAWKLPDDPQIARQSVPLPSPLSPLSLVVGRITGMVDCRWHEGAGGGGRGTGCNKDQSLIPNPQSLVSLGDQFNLASGLMEITYDTGAKVILQGPVTYEVESAVGGYLSVGKLTAKVEKKVASGQWPVASEKSEIRNPKSQIPNLQISKSPNRSSPAPLFSVRTPNATVTDLGTEFGVEVNKDGLTQVHVLQGVVDAQVVNPSDGTERHRRLTEGTAIEIGQKSDRFIMVAFAPRSFTRQLPVMVDNPAEAAYIRAVLADQPMGYWPLNEPAGSRKFFDRSGNGVHGYAMREVMAGQHGPLPGSSRAIELNGNGYIDFGRRDQFAMKNDFTVEAWAWIGKAALSSYAISVLGHNGAKHIGWGLIAGHLTHQSDSKNAVALYFAVYEVEYFHFPFSKGESIKDRWCHVAVVFDRANTAHLYLNGTHRGSATKDQPAHVGPVWLQIGCAEIEDADFWRGRLAHVAVYPCALSGQQINNHYDRRNSSGSELNWKETP